MEEHQAQSFFYEALSPLSLSPADTPDQSPPSDYDQPYSVFRNEISQSTLDANGGLLDTYAPDFFSLDVAADGISASSQSQVSPAPVTPALRREDEPRFESVWFRGNCRFNSPMLQLHKEIVDFCDFLSPTLEEEASRNAAVKCVFDVIKFIWPNCSVEVFGSFKTRLYLPTSDIDAVILGSGIPNPQSGLNGLAKALSQRGIAKKIQVIAKARVPIIKFVEKRSGVAFDISFDVQNGPKAADFIMDTISRWPPLRPLCLILKVFLHQRELNEVYSGGIGSFALLAMLIALLQNLHESQSYREHNLGVLLVHFFDFYGRKLNTSDVGVSCSGAGTFFSKSSKGFLNKGRPILISIEDPQVPENDIGKNSFNYYQIKSAFAMAFTTLTNPKTILSLGPNRSILGTIIRPDPVLLKRKGGSNGEVTFNSLLPGAGEPLQPNHGDEQEIFGNWQLDDEEEPLPRGNDIDGDADANSSGKKRKASTELSGGKKVKENGEVGRIRSGSRKGYGSKRKRWRDKRDAANGFSRHAWSR